MSEAPDAFRGGRSRAADALELLMRGRGRVLAKAGGRIYSNRLSIEIAAETAGATPVGAGVEVVVRREPSVEFSDIASTLRSAEGEDFLFLRGLERMRRADPGHAYVARSPDGEIAASLFAHDVAARDRLEHLFPGFYPPLAQGDVLTEGVYCWPGFRGLRVTSHLLTSTLNLLATSGVRRALAVIETANIASVRAFARAGYVPTGVLRHSAYRLNQWRSTFVDDEAMAQRHWQDIVGSRDGCSGCLVPGKARSHSTQG